jgi:hypothetical protein
MFCVPSLPVKCILMFLRRGFTLDSVFDSPALCRDLLLCTVSPLGSSSAECTSEQMGLSINIDATQ